MCAWRCLKIQLKLSLLDYDLSCDKQVCFSYAQIKWSVKIFIVYTTIQKFEVGTIFKAVFIW